MAQTYKITSELKGAINFTTTSNTKYICFRLGVSKSENTVTYKNIMLLKGTYTVDNIPTYEQYGASPSPDYPAEIATVKDSVKIDIVNNDSTKSQTAIMPVQQEMLNGDYIADVEHHVWGKLILMGDEDWHKSSTTEVDRFSYNTSDYPAFAKGLSNYFLVQKGIGTNVGRLVFNAGTQIVVNFSDYGTTTLEEFKAWLKSKYDEGNPVIVYYKLATPVNLELTEEQKAIRDTKLYTYKNVTNISLSDELASLDIIYSSSSKETINEEYINDTNVNFGEKYRTN